MTLFIGLVLLGALGWISLTRLRWQWGRLQAALRHAELARHGTSSGVASNVAVELCMEPELRWAIRQHVPAAVVYLSVRDGDPAVAGERLARAVRQYERAYETDEAGCFAVLLWNTDADGAVASARRFAQAIAGSDGWDVHAGHALAPDDAVGAREAIEVARSRTCAIVDRHLRAVADVEQRAA